MNKKAVELPITAMVIVAIGLVVLVVFFSIFTSEAGEFSKNIRSCELKGGVCVGQGECQYEKTSWSCPKKEQPECCVNPSGR